MRTRHLSVRVDPYIFDRLDTESRHAGLSVSELARSLIDEVLRMQAHPGIVFRSGPAGRRPALPGGPDIWEIARVFGNLNGEDEPPTERTAELTGLSPEQVAAAAGYYVDYPNEIDDWILRVDEEANQAEHHWQRTRQLLRR
jgi:hypothetical protein